MNASTTSRLLMRSGIQNVLRPATVMRTTSISLRPFSSTPTHFADPPNKSGASILSSLYGSSTASPPPKTSSPQNNSQDGSGRGISSVMDILGGALGANTGTSTGASSTRDFQDLASDKPDALEPYHIHIYSHKHNTHVAVTKPDRGVIISMSAGNLGFRKSRRKSYDAAYQTTAYVLERLKFFGWEPKINRLELVLRGFGTGREAGVKVLMAPEGAAWRKKIVRVADNTRLKFGGTRSPNIRRI